MHVASVSVRYGLILEAYCHGSIGHVKSLTKQVAALNKFASIVKVVHSEAYKNISVSQLTCVFISGGNGNANTAFQWLMLLGNLGVVESGQCFYVSYKDGALAFRFPGVVHSIRPSLLKVAQKPSLTL